MKKLLLFLIIVSLVMAGVANATTVWNPAANDPPIVPPDVGNWNEAANWTNGVPVMVGDSLTYGTHTKAVFNVPDSAECQVTDAQFVGDSLVMGDNNTCGVLRVMDGGRITTGDAWMAVGYNNPATFIVERGGRCDFGSHMWLGHIAGAEGSVMEINGGIVTNEEAFELGRQGGAADLFINSGELNVDHGNIIVNIMATNPYIDPGKPDEDPPVPPDPAKNQTQDSNIDISFGTFTIDDNRVADIEYIRDQGRMTAFGGAGTLLIDYDESNAERTTVTATGDPLNRYPTMDETVDPGYVTLNWNNIASVPPGGPVWVDVWFGTDANWGQNESDPNIWEYPDFTRIVDASKDQVSVDVSLLTDTTEGFFWKVNTYVYGDPANGQHNYGDDPNLASDLTITEGMLMNFHAPNGPSCAGLADFNCDGIVDLADFPYIASVWLTNDFKGDIADPPDNTVDVLDLSVYAQQWFDVSAEIAYWAFDETEGAVASDSSANDFHGTLIDMDDSDWVPGNTGNALDFDGLDDHVTVDDIFAELPGRDLTVSAWVNAPAVKTAHQFIISINTSNGDDNRILLGIQANSDTLSMYESGWRDTATTVIDGTWHHIAYVLNNSSNTMTIYVDGSDVLSFTSTASIAAADVFSLGQEYDAGMITGDFYSGQLDDVRIYDRALSQAEIEILAQ